MRLTCLLAVLSAVLSAGAAQACFIFKCFRHSAAPAPAAAPLAVQREAAGDDLAKLYMKITFVGGFKVDEALGEPTDEVDPNPYVEIIVETDAWTGTWCDVNLDVSGGTARLAAAPVMLKAAAKKPRVVFKERRVKKPKAAAAAGPASPSILPTSAPPTAYEFVFHVYDLEYFHTYKTYAYSWACGMSSAAVTFKTKQASSESPPGPPHGASGPLKK
jgi:hypothetical protein